MSPVFGWDLVLYEPGVVRIGFESGSTVNPTEVMDEPFFNFDPVEVIVMGLIQLWRSYKLNLSSRLDGLNGVLDADIKPRVLTCFFLCSLTPNS